MSMWPFIIAWFNILNAIRNGMLGNIVWTGISAFCAGLFVCIAAIEYSKRDWERSA